MTLKAKNYVLAPIHYFHVQHCPASRIYVGKRPKTRGNWYGIAVHLYLEKYMKLGLNRKAALAYINGTGFKKYAKSLAKIDVESIPVGEPEVQFLIDTGARKAYVADSWQDADPELHFTARCDLVVERKFWDSSLPKTNHWVFDYKSGSTAMQQSQWAHQQRIMAVARWMCLGRPSERIGSCIAAIDTDSGRIEYKTAAFSSTHLRTESRKLRRIHLQVLETRAEWRDEGIEPEFKAGVWCSNCSAQSDCDTFKAHQVRVHVKGHKLTE